MLAQTITLSFSSFAADTIRIHTGETGREIAFVPDMEISGNYSADFIVIKPDDTFVIAAATITDGKINVVIPEQAGAVAGAGHYILKIYDSGSVCIYSASGGFMVDDHLLTDGIIESVAEVYGYNFPEDFALKSEIPDIDDIIDDEITGTNSTWSSTKIAEEIEAASPDPSTFIDDNEVLYNKTWSSEKISYELGQITGLDIYSTTEQPVGKWTDGSMVYQKTFVINSPSQSSWSSFNLGVSGLNEIISISGSIIFSNLIRPFPYWEEAGEFSCCYYVKANGNLQYRIASYLSPQKLYATIRYTKTA